MRAPFLFWLLPCLLASCGALASSATGQNLAGEWRLTALPSASAVRVSDAATLRIEGEPPRASGSTGVNRYAGPVDVRGEDLRFGALASTRRAGPPDAMALEQAFLQALQATARWRIRDRDLELLDVQGAVVARFAPRG